MNVHLTVGGLYELCPLLPQECEHLHLPGVTSIAEAQALPTPFLEQILAEVDDSQMYVTEPGQMVKHPLEAGSWMAKSRLRVWYSGRIVHRGYGLPAMIGEDGLRVWCYEGSVHRPGGLPAVINPSATNAQRLFQAWVVDGRLHRTGGEPAIIDGSNQYFFENGMPTKPGICLFSEIGKVFRLETPPPNTALNVYGERAKLNEPGPLR